MANTNAKVTEINEILKRTMEAIEEGKQDIFKILEAARSEYNKAKEELGQVQKKVKTLIKEVEILENQERVSRKILLSVSKEFSSYTEENIKAAYENANNLQIKLALKRHEERNLIRKRTDLEIRLKNTDEILKKAENLMSKIGVAFDILNDDLEGVSSALKSAAQINIIGKRIIQVQEEERHRIAMDIHDGPAQSLTNAVIKTEVCERLIDKDTNNTKTELHELKLILKQSIEDIRKIIYDLRPMALEDVGLVPIIRRYINNFQSDTNIEVDFIMVSKMDIDDDIKKIALFRIMQEALSNIKKHSGATLVKIKIENTIEKTYLIIEDNGIGFDTGESKAINTPEGGFGLFNMRERIELLNGKFEIRSQVNCGTKIIVSIPNES